MRCLPLSDVNIGSEYNNHIAVIVFFEFLFPGSFLNLFSESLLRNLPVGPIYRIAKQLKRALSRQCYLATALWQCESLAFEVFPIERRDRNNLKVSSGDGSGGDR